MTTTKDFHIYRTYHEPFHPPNLLVSRLGVRDMTGEAEGIGGPPSPDQLIAHEWSMVGYRDVPKISESSQPKQCRGRIEKQHHPRRDGGSDHRLRSVKGSADTIWHSHTVNERDPIPHRFIIRCGCPAHIYRLSWSTKISRNGHSVSLLKYCGEARALHQRHGRQYGARHLDMLLQTS